MEVDTAARRMLLTVPTVIGYVGSKVFKNVLSEHVNGTGGRAVVLRRGNGWAPPSRVQTSEYPSLVVECWADADRLGDMVTTDNAVDKAFALQRVVSRVMHRQRDVWWGAGGTNRGVRIITSMQNSEPSVETEKDQHGGIPMGDCAVVSVRFDLHVAP